MGSPYVFTEARVQKFLSDGRGQGAGATFAPWLQIQDVPSSGRSHRPYGIKSKRVHHLLSDGEWKSFLRLEADPQVIDIWEQFPMDRLETYRIARELGVRHPRTVDGTPYVMTLDFMVTKAGARSVELVPYTFKYYPDTLTAREQELMAITRRFCEVRGLKLRLIDETFFDEPFNINYDSVRAYYDIDQLEFSRHTDVASIVRALLDEISVGSEATLLRICRLFAATMDTTPQVVHQIAMHLVARGVLRVDLSSALGLERLPMSAYTIAQVAAPQLEFV